MLQTYRPEQVFIETLPTGEKICRIRSFKSKDAPSPVHPSVKSKTGWWSGALSSRDSDTEKYYPLFCRIEIKAKVPYLYGLWNALWLRHYKGAGVAEIDILEFLPKLSGKSLSGQSESNFAFVQFGNAKVGNQSTQRSDTIY